MAQQWHTIRDLMSLQDRMNQLFEDATERRTRDGDHQNEIDRTDWVPLADVYERKDEFVLALDLPGIDRDALTIDLEEERLSIRGSRKLEEQRLRGAERPRGRFSRTFTVPSAVDPEQIAADYKDGVLLVHLPKRAEPKSQRVEIKVS